jgi:hypothetical protein
MITRRNARERPPGFGVVRNGRLTLFDMHHQFLYLPFFSFLQFFFPCVFFNAPNNNNNNNPLKKNETK